ncbi:MAG: PIN domain-containing protein [Polyangiaceae bacterium]|nr:PIN domain-containing protein [Polyangiaceae bacterium]
MVSLVDTNILVYRYDPRFPDKQQKAAAVLRKGIEERSIRVPHQAIIEFVAVVTRPMGKHAPLLSVVEARREVEEMLLTFDVIYPSEAVIRLALHGATTYQLSWFDAHLWAYAEHYGLSEILSEDFQDGCVYGTVRVRNPLT